MRRRCAQLARRRAAAAAALATSTLAAVGTAPPTLAPAALATTSAADAAATAAPIGANTPTSNATSFPLRRRRRVAVLWSASVRRLCEQRILCQHKSVWPGCGMVGFCLLQLRRD